MQPSPPPPRIAWTRVFGLALVGAGMLGLMISLAGLIGVIIVGARAEAALTRQLATLDRSLTATGDGLAVADSALAETRITLTSLSTTIGSATRALTETQPALESLYELTGEGLPETIASTREALDSAQAAARTAEGVLRALAIFGQPYNPDVPLDVAIGRVSASLGELPPSLAEVSSGLNTASANIATVASELEEVAAGLDAIATSVGDAAMVVEQYQQIVADLRAEVAAMQATAPGWLAAARVGMTLLLIWLGLAQIGLLTQGWELLGRPPLRRFPGRPRL
ncbi:MAG TPA: hypothetical protein PKD53_18270 [Chloroflexaceae bacterium]|nr:hypothetical protein [Chloroflexaceae bacterium]